ncbi:MAG: aminoacetone oxidase family FAD-binding enzyme [Candidatus Kapaibacterium sp.]
MSRTVAIIGGGAAGIFAALAARSQGALALLYERNRRIGIKILISGGGKCNITHDAPPDEIEEGFITGEARFLRYALHELTAADVLAALRDEGVETITRPNGRVFPASGRAEDVLAAFERMLSRAGVEILTNAHVEKILTSDGAVSGLIADGVRQPCDAIVVATGGMSYRNVGTTGDGIRWAKELGHLLVPVRPALAPIYFPQPPPATWQGVALRDVILRIESDGRRPKLPRGEGFPTEWRDDLLLTHRGISGPSALEVSRAAARVAEDSHPVHLVVDLLPDIPADALPALWEERVLASGKSEVQTFVEGFIPRALVGFLLDAARLRAGIKMNSVTKEERALLLRTLKGWTVGVVGSVPLDKGEVTAGGIALGEVHSTTMASKRIDGLFFAGEALDISGRVGGYNLQAAFSTGHVAGISAAAHAPSLSPPETR